MLDTGAVKSTVLNGIVCVRFLWQKWFICSRPLILLQVRLVSEELAARLEKEFIKDMLALDLKFVRAFSSRNPSPSHPFGLPLALHTARISSRISQDKSLLLQYVSDKSSTSISDLMDTLLRAAGIHFLLFLISLSIDFWYSSTQRYSFFV